MRRLIFLIGSTETLEYFSLQMAEYFRKAGREVFVWDMRQPLGSREAFEKLDGLSDSLFITFNFLGLCGEGQFAVGLSNVWDLHDVQKLCIMVDSPAYYHRQLSSHMKRLTLVCIDSYHRKYAKEMYPEYGEVYFMPLAGNRPLNRLWADNGILKPHSVDYFGYENIPWKDRPVDIVFTGNHITVESIEVSVKKLGQDYRDFIESIIHQFMSNPLIPFEDTVLGNLKKEFPDSSQEEYGMALFQMVYIDLFVRSVYREKIVTALADSGMKVYCTGKDWDKVACRHPENIIHTGNSVTSIECLRAMSMAKVSLNVMPWFKDGIHDRMLSSMLQRCAVVSDSSEYIDNIMISGKEYKKFTLGSPEESGADAAEKTAWLLSHGDDAVEMAVRGYEFASSGHTWEDRAKSLEKIIE